MDTSEMNDPYKTPQASVEVRETVSKTGWKVFFWILLVLEVLSLAFMVIDPAETLLKTLLETIIYLSILTGIFGFAYHRKLLFRRFWIALIPIGLIYDAYTLILLDWGFESAEEMYFSLALIALLLIPLMFFQYLALYKYGFRSADIWGREAAVKSPPASDSN